MTVAVTQVVASSASYFRTYGPDLPAGARGALFHAYARTWRKRQPKR